MKTEMEGDKYWMAAHSSAGRTKRRCRWKSQPPLSPRGVEDVCNLIKESTETRQLLQRRRRRSDEAPLSATAGFHPGWPPTSELRAQFVRLIGESADGLAVIVCMWNVSQLSWRLRVRQRVGDAAVERRAPRTAAPNLSTPSTGLMYERIALIIKFHRRVAAIFF